MIFPNFLRIPFIATVTLGASISPSASQYLCNHPSLKLNSQCEKVISSAENEGEDTSSITAFSLSVWILCCNLYSIKRIAVPGTLNTHRSGILPLPLRKVMQEKNEAGGGWIEKDTGCGDESGAGCLPLPIGAPSTNRQTQGAPPRPRSRQTRAGLLWEGGTEIGGRFTCGSRCGVAWTGVLDEPSVAFFTHEPHP